MSSEAQARVTINKMLEEAGWRFLPDGQSGRENIVCEHRITRRAFSPNQDLGKDFEHAPDGFVDYVLLNTDQRPVGVVEAKKESIDPLTAKEQARTYSESLGVSHIFLSNGLVHWYWNLRQGNPIKVARFLPLGQLGKDAEWQPDAARLAAVAVESCFWLIVWNWRIRHGGISTPTSLPAAFKVTFGSSDYERKFFSDEINLSFVRCFLDNAKRDPITGETGKAIMFAVSRRHATKLVTLLNEEATRRWPREYAAGSTFAVQITSDIPGAQQMTIDFANNNLNGKSRWRADDSRDYDTSRTRVCVTVGMMTTGYDCEDVLNVVLARAIFSPTDFIQIKGRGTRLFGFKHGEGAEQRSAKKDGFALFDFFANCEYFEDDFDYDEKLSLPKGPPAEGGESGEVGICIEDFTNT